jgi:hypothetical protein
MLAAAAGPVPVIFVDHNNTTGLSDGSAAKPFTTIQAAINSAAGNAIIEVAKGTYNESVVVPDRNMQLLGGFAGAAPATYAGGNAGDFSASDPTANLTRIVGSADSPVVYLNNIAARTVVVDGFDISGGHTGIYVQADYLLFSDVTISNNIIENNGPAELQQDGGDFSDRGGGIYSSDATITITHNTIRNNNANRGGGMFIDSKSGFTITDNLIEDNSGYDDHGGGVGLSPLPKTAPGEAVFSRNIVRGNAASKAFTYGWAGGVLIGGGNDAADLKPITMSNDIITGNSAPSRGGGLFVDNGATVILKHELIYANHTDLTTGGIYVDGDAGGAGSFLTILNSTIANNTSPDQDGNGVYVEEFSHVTVSNSIFWGNGDDFWTDDSSTITAKYIDSQEAWPGTGNIRANPLFANAAGGDFHLQSTVGRWDESAQGGAGAWVQDANQSPAIDAGDPAAAFANEPAPNGNRLNLGIEGNTGLAGQSASAGMTTTTLARSASSTKFGAKVTFTATVGLAEGSSGTLSGAVHFYDGAKDLGSAPVKLVAGARKAVFSITALGAGTHTIMARYFGTSLLSPSSSPTVSQVVKGLASATALATVRTSASKATLTATVQSAPAGGVLPTGSVVFKEGSTVLGTAPIKVVGGKAKAVFAAKNLSAGTHHITATYSGNTRYAGSARAGVV